ncbi:MAG TPA: hypothetical protein VG077_01980 [Verrucomicrobiae bacterium]|nr:hypothetical protein [Verrucomicrobiae bacterium]
MKLRRLPALLGLMPALVILMAGCATHHPLASTWHESQFSPTRADKIALTLRPQPSPEDAELDRLLVGELKREGFNLVPIEKADYLMAGTMSDELLEDPRQQITINTPAAPPQTTGQILSQSESLASSVPASRVSRPVVFRQRGIRLFLYTNPKTNPGGFQIVWQGYIVTGQTVTAERETLLIRTLLGYFGQEQHGLVNLIQ